jgi:type VI secretion system secreted protein Hcp
MHLPGCKAIRDARGLEVTMALSAYLRLTGQSQGPIEGPVTQKGREDTIEVFGWNHELISPRDPVSGHATGKTQHSEITIIKAIDKTTPVLLRALVTNELITSWSLECWRSTMTGVQELYYRIELGDAAISRIASAQLNNQHPENANIEPREHVSFVYQKIIWTWLDGGVMAEDSWASSA